jgi:hypothetical protein
VSPGPEDPDNKVRRTREGVYANADVVFMFVRIETEGLTACPRSSGTKRCDWAPWWPCERCEVEAALGKPVDATRPSDIAIAYALRIWAMYEDALGDRAAPIHRAHEEGMLLQESERRRLSPRLQERKSRLIRNRLLNDARFNEKLEVFSAAHEILMQGQWLEPDGSGLTPEEASTLQGLQRGHFPELPPHIRDAAEKRVAERASRARGEKRKDVRWSRADRRRLLTLPSLSFRQQLGLGLSHETDPRKLARLVSELRRQARKRGLLPPDHDRRRRDARDQTAD